MFYGLKSKQESEILQHVLKILSTLFPRTYMADNLIAISRCMGFLDDREFMSAFRHAARTEQDKSLVWRLHTLAWAARQCASLPGDFVECGVFRGFCSEFVARYLNFATDHPTKKFYLYDTFEGMPEGYLEGSPVSDHAYREPGLFAQVLRRFEAYPNIEIVKGTVPEIFQAGPVPAQVAFLHLDMNSAEAEIGALEHLFNRVVSGGVIVLDDYGWQAYRAQKAREDAFMNERGYSILELPTGQGLMVKR